LAFGLALVPAFGLRAARLFAAGFFGARGFALGGAFGRAGRGGSAPATSAMSSASSPGLGSVGAESPFIRSIMVSSRRKVVGLPAMCTRGSRGASPKFAHADGAVEV